jgi:hypothetical protein
MNEVSVTGVNLLMKSETVSISVTDRAKCAMMSIVGFATRETVTVVVCGASPAVTGRTPRRAERRVVPSSGTSVNFASGEQRKTVRLLATYVESRGRAEEEVEEKFCVRVHRKGVTR